MRDDLADLGMPAAAIDLLHQIGETLGLRHPARGAAFGETAVIDQLHVEPADRRRLAEHIGLQVAGRIPHRLAAHGGVEREDEPPALAGGGCWREAFHLGQEGIDLGTPGRRRRRMAAVCRGPVVAILGHGYGTSMGGSPAGP